MVTGLPEVDFMELQCASPDLWDKDASTLLAIDKSNKYNPESSLRVCFLFFVES